MWGSWSVGVASDPGAVVRAVGTSEDSDMGLPPAELGSLRWMTAVAASSSASNRWAERERSDPPVGAGEVPGVAPVAGTGEDEEEDADEDAVGLGAVLRRTESGTAGASAAAGFTLTRGGATVRRRRIEVEGAVPAAGEPGVAGAPAVPGGAGVGDDVRPGPGAPGPGTAPSSRAAT